ncbi:cell division protein CrgA [Tsukamurella asaccharolytica]|uniref:Cell division protein CrgA n=1 Tax=Tsukamurella asaccharolytica TaxID=2592067 RepID=A0A5C5R3P9_9ACTN|nr:cell division protein CrgA [Tsukamurella asaccharolytica]TWS17649.1 cell division protein CrgA [Tsukamurella asaccharolytica]
MPKSKVRKKTDYTINTATDSRTPVKVNAPSGRWFVVAFLALMLAGLAWLLVYYVGADPNGMGAPGKPLEWMANLEAWNFAIGFGLMITGLLMTMWWK